MRFDVCSAIVTSMTSIVDVDYRAQALACASLGNRFRLHIMDLLVNTHIEHSVTGVCQWVGADLSRSTVTYHLAVLVRAGLVSQRREWPQIYNSATVLGQGLYVTTANIIEKNLYAN